MRLIYQEDIYLAEGEVVDGLDCLPFKFKAGETWDVDGFKIVSLSKK